MTPFDQPEPAFDMTAMMYSRQYERWFFTITFSDAHYDRYFQLAKASNGIDRILLERDGKKIVAADVLIKRGEDRHCVWMEICRAFDYLTQVN